LSFTRKAPKKVIALLQAIMALGPENVSVHSLIDALWPDTEGDVGQESFQQALHRLRRLLGVPDAIQVEGGKVSLNAQVVWTDVRAFTELLRAGDNEDERMQEALALYRGGFLEVEAQAAWAVVMRERLRTSFLRGVEKAGHRLEAEQAW